MNRPAAVALVALAAGVAFAEQKQSFGAYEMHYSVFNPTFLRTEIAERYNLVRGRDKALLNVSVLRGDQSVVVAVTGTVKNLLGQSQPLDFRQVRDGDAVYYLAMLTYQDRDTLRFEISADLPGYGPAAVRFQQTLYWEAAGASAPVER